MQLSPLQSRLAASVVASFLLVLLYLALFSPNFALAADLEQMLPVLLDDAEFPRDILSSDRSTLDATYEPEFAAFDRSLIGRAPAGVTAVTNNVPSPMNVVAGTMQYFVFTVPSVTTRGDEQDRNSAPLELREAKEDELLSRDGLVERAATRTVFISANTCLQPQVIDASKTTMDPPQLTLYVSTSPSNQAPSPMGDSSTQTLVQFSEGAVMYNTTASGDIYFGVHAPNVSTLFSGTTYNFQIAASVDAWYHSYDVESNADLIWVDSDSQGAILMTHNLTDSSNPIVDEQVMSSQPYVMFAQNVNDRSINGLAYSYCGLGNYAQIAATNNGKFTSLVTTTMTRLGPGGLPKQQFFFTGLNASSSYVGILASPRNTSALTKRDAPVIGGGGHVFRATNFTTKSDHDNCRLITQLDFCDQVAYAVPSNPKFGNSTVLGQFYDNYAASMYDTFANKVMAQISCEAPSSQLYSLARSCDDCTNAYKSWLCSVAIPKCEDFDNNATYLQPRAINQSFPNGDVLDSATLNSFPQTNAFLTSRNPMIDQVLSPGPYKEVLPCDDLCYALVQSCPASLGFSCPRQGGYGYNTSYGRRTQADENGEITCNYPGSMHLFSAAGHLAVPWVVLGATVVSLMLQLL